MKPELETGTATRARKTLIGVVLGMGLAGMTLAQEGLTALSLMKIAVIPLYILALVGITVLFRRDRADQDKAPTFSPRFVAHMAAIGILFASVMMVMTFHLEKTASDVAIQFLVQAVFFGGFMGSSLLVIGRFFPTAKAER